VIDTAGPDLGDQCVREGQAFLPVYSIGSRSSFDRLEVFRETVKRIKGRGAISILVVNLLPWKREVSEEEGISLARQWGCEFVKTLAKTAQNVERAFRIPIGALRADIIIIIIIIIHSIIVPAGPLGPM